MGLNVRATDQEDAAVMEVALPHPLEEFLDVPRAVVIAGGELQPVNVGAEVHEAEEILKEKRPETSGLRVPREAAVAEDDARSVHRSSVKSIDLCHISFGKKVIV
jgi:hypothetical protein